MWTYLLTAGSQVSYPAGCQIDFFDASNTVIGSIGFNRYGQASKKVGGVTTMLVANGVVNIGSHSVTFTKAGWYPFIINQSGHERSRHRLDMGGTNVPPHADK